MHYIFIISASLAAMYLAAKTINPPAKQPDRPDWYRKVVSPRRRY